jgi:SAM-dependent methyltransferase
MMPTSACLEVPQEEIGMDVDSDYVHGYSPREDRRLVDQANALTDLLHGHTAYPPGSLVLEAGCGVGAQTVTLAERSPAARFVSVDVAPDSLRAARERAQGAAFGNVAFSRADLFALPFPPSTFDHVFVCFVLEHVAEPERVLAGLKRVLKPGGTLTVIEGDHGSAYFHPESPFARRAIQCLVDQQARAGGNSLIGRALYPLLVRAGFADVRVSPRMVYVDASRPELVTGFTRNTFTAMVEGVRERALASGAISLEEWEQGIADLYRTAETDGTFCYCFFKAVAVRR